MILFIIFSFYDFAKDQTNGREPSCPTFATVTSHTGLICRPLLKKTSP